MSCKGCLAKLCLSLLHGALGQKLPCEWILWAFVSNCLANMRFSQSFCMELSCIKLPCKAICWAFAWNCRAKVASWTYFVAFAWNYAKTSFQSCFSSFYVELLCNSCLSKLLFKLLFGTGNNSGLAKLPLRAKGRSVFPECCAVLLSNGRGLGRSLSYVGRNQIRPIAMLHAALVHKFICEAIS